MECRHILHTNVHVYTHRHTKNASADTDTDTDNTHNVVTSVHVKRTLHTNMCAQMHTPHTYVTY